jgi:hypothetical protein
MPSSSMKFFRALNPYPAHPVGAGFDGLRPSFSEAPTDPGAVLEVKRSPAEKVTAKFGAFRRGIWIRGSLLQTRPVLPDSVPTAGLHPGVS